MITVITMLFSNPEFESTNTVVTCLMEGEGGSMDYVRLREGGVGVNKLCTA